MKYGSLFSGIGGLDCGLARAGHEGQFLCESDPWRREILAARFPGVPIYSDVREVTKGARPGGLREVGGERHDADAGRGRTCSPHSHIDLLVGGFPCQDLSVAGKRRGFAGERSSLFFEFARIADELVHPGGYVLIENVPGLFSSHGGRDFAALLGKLADLGFHDLAWRVLDSQFFGVPQRRRRVFILARRARGRRCAEILLEPESRSGNPPTRNQTREGIAGTLGSRTPNGGPRTTDLDGHGAYVVKDIADTLHARMAKGQAGRENQETRNLYITHALSSVGADASEDGTGRGTPMTLAQSGVRRLTPTECERLQGLPDGWTLPGSDSKRYAALGDAVTANVAEWIGRRFHLARS